MIKTKENSEHYSWGNNCDGWHLVQSSSLSIIEELMPPHTEETSHYHEKSQQFFRILKGTATFYVNDEVIKVPAGKGIHILPGIRHQIKNEEDVNLEFLVISEPTTRGDRIQ